MAQHKFKPGDKIKCLSQSYSEVKKDQEVTVKGYSKWNELALVGINDEFPCYNEKHFELVKPVGKIVGYKLLKDSTSANAGSIVTQHENGRWYGPTRFGNTALVNIIVLEQTEWFEPIYEPEHQVLTTCNGKRLEFHKNTKTIHLLDDIVSSVTSFHKASVIANRALSINTKSTKVITKNDLEYLPIVLEVKIKLGCIELNREDLQNVLKAIE